MKVNVLLGPPTSPDITTEEMLRQWEGLLSIPGIQYTVKHYTSFPTAAEFNRLIDEDCEAALGIWISKQFLTEDFLKPIPASAIWPDWLTATKRWIFLSAADTESPSQTPHTARLP